MPLLAAYFRRSDGPDARSDARPWVRPWALVTPVVILIFCLPLLRPLHHPGQASVDEQLRLATISALVQHRTDGGSLAQHLAINARFYMPRSHVISIDKLIYSDQAPMLAFLLSGPYLVLHAMGYRLEENSVLVPYLLTLLGATLPAVAAAGLVYRMGRIFELRRQWRTALAATVVFGTGLISYAVVLNAHVPAAVLILGSAGCLVHLAASKNPARGGHWIVLAGLCAALAATIDLSASIFLVLLLAVIPAMRLPMALRIGGVVLYLFGATPAILLHASLVVPLTGNLLPGSMHPELLVHRRTIIGDDLDPPMDDQADTEIYYEQGDVPDDTGFTPPAPTAWQQIWHGIGQFFSALIGPHGLLVHFPIVILGVVGMFAVMHRHWPLTTKVLAADSAIAAILGIVGFALTPHSAVTAEFGNRWLIIFLPILLFWAGAWLRQSHHRATWWTAGVLLLFSVAVSLIGASDPMPVQGYTHYTAGAALYNLLHQPIPEAQAAIAGR